MPELGLLYREGRFHVASSVRWREAEGCYWRTHSKLCIDAAYPVSEDHSLVIPQRHVADGMDLHQPEWIALVELLRQWREMLSARDATITGWNVGWNSGGVAGHTVFHAHWHLIPRQTGDDNSPRRGVRGVIKGKQPY
jgi:diadenosine tetraphosphate (Ap4A) HIT family hydrolase